MHMVFKNETQNENAINRKAATSGHDFLGRKSRVILSKDGNVHPNIWYSQIRPNGVASQNTKTWINIAVKTSNDNLPASMHKDE